MSDEGDKCGNGAIDSCGNAAEEQNQLLGQESDLKAIEIISSGKVPKSIHFTICSFIPMGDRFESCLFTTCVNLNIFY